MTTSQLRQYATATKAVQSGLNQDQNHKSVVAPIYMATNFEFDTLEQKPAFDYSRGGNPTRDLLAQALAELENGTGAVVTSSGMAAINLVLQLLTPNDILVAPQDCYGGTHRLFNSLAQKGAFKVLWVDIYANDLQQQLLEIKPNFIWLETPSNPLLRVTDIQQVCKSAKLVNAKVVVDNTFLSPVGQSPLSLGADIVVHSSTKYLNGHSDVVSGAVICKHAEDQEQLSWWANNTGCTGAPFDSYLILRGIRTLPLRIKQHSENAQAIAELLEAHELINQVHYSGLPRHQDHLLASRQQAYHGGMLSFKLDTSKVALLPFLKALKLFTLAESLGGTESLVCHPATMTHAAMDDEAQQQAGITKSLVRFSVGIEDKQDLIADVLQALEIGRSQYAENQVVRPAISADSDVQETATCRLSPALAALW